MRWTGKITGFFAGWLAGGPFGSIIGLLVGHYFDKGRLIHPSWGSRVKIQQSFFEATFSIMGYIAKADGRVSEEEIALARHIMAQMALTQEQKKEAIHLFNRGKQSTFDPERVLNDLVNCCKLYKDLLRIFVEIQFQAAYADGNLTPEERRILKHICYRLGFSAIEFFTFDKHFKTYQRYQHYQRKDQTARPKEQEQIKDAYQILGISRNVSDQELKQAYRRLMSQHHPDKLMAKGLPESLIKLATEKTQEIKLAYEQIAKARGLK